MESVNLIGLQNFEKQGHDVDKFESFFTQQNGKAFSLEDPPIKLYYFNKYGGWCDIIDGKKYYYDADCNPIISNLPDDIDEIPNPVESDQLNVFLSKIGDLAIADADEYEIENGQEGLYQKENEFDDIDLIDERNIDNSLSDAENKQDQSIESIHSQNQDNSQQYTKEQEENEQSDSDKNEKGIIDMIQNIDDQDFEKQEYLNELKQDIDAGLIEISCVQIDQIPINLSEDKLLQSFNIFNRQGIIAVLYGEPFPEFEDEIGHTQFVREAALIVESKEFAKGLIDFEGAPIEGCIDRQLLLDVLSDFPKSSSFYPIPACSNNQYKLFVETLQAQQNEQFQKKILRFELIECTKEFDLSMTDAFSSSITFWNDLVKNDGISSLKSVEVLKSSEEYFEQQQ